MPNAPLEETRAGRFAIGDQPGGVAPRARSSTEVESLFGLGGGAGAGAGAGLGVGFPFAFEPFGGCAELPCGCAGLFGCGAAAGSGAGLVSFDDFPGG